MMPTHEVLLRMVFRKQGSPDIRLCIWRDRPDALYANVEQEGSPPRKHCWSQNTTVPWLVGHYEQELGKAGYKPSEFHPEGPIVPNATVVS